MANKNRPSTYLPPDWEDMNLARIAVQSSSIKPVEKDLIIATLEWAMGELAEEDFSDYLNKISK